MDGPREVKITLNEFLKRSWPLIAVGAVFVLFASGILLWIAVSGKGRKATAPAKVVEQTAATTTNVLVPRAIDGILVAPAEASLLPFAVMIDNHVDARPESGLASANLVIEAPVEGGLTRYMAVFDATSTADQIGPVRSARPYFIDLADALGAVYAHVGGSPDALEQIKHDTKFKNVDEYFSGKYFWRSAKRYPPHNAYTRMDLLRDAASARSWTAGSLRGWRYADEAGLESATGTTATSTGSIRGTVPGPVVKYGGSDNVSWVYDRTQNVYARNVGGWTLKDLDGTSVVAKNVAVLLTDAQVLDDVGRLKMRTTGRGSAVLYRDGRMHRLMWYRSSGEQFRFETIDGADATFTRGTTWIEIVTSPLMYAKADPGFSTASTTAASR